MRSLIIDIPHRKPSLREVERDCPPNVAILPRASRTRVRQRSGRAVWEATDALKASQNRSFPHKSPMNRQAERNAAAIDAAEKDVAVHLTHAILAELDPETKSRVIARLQVAADDSAAAFQAYAVAATTDLTYGEHVVIQRALNQLRNTASPGSN